MAPSVADIARWLEELPTTVAGWAVIEVADETEQIPLTAPGGVEIRWLHRDGRPPGTGDALERTVRALPVPTDEQVYVWMAGEAASLEPLRHWSAGSSAAMLGTTTSGAIGSAASPTTRTITTTRITATDETHPSSESRAGSTAFR